MTKVPMIDVRQIDDDTRVKFARKIQKSKDFQLPELSHWNSEPCRQHRNGWTEIILDPETGEEKEHTVLHRPKPACRQCGLILARHQRIGVAWMYMAKNALLADTMGAGKALADSEDVITPTGIRPMSDIRVGDLVMGSSGMPTTVVGVYPQGVKSIYKVTFSDGSTVHATDDHLWSVRTPSEKYHGKGYRVLSTAELASKGLHAKSGNAKWYIPMASPVEFEEREVPLDPYLVGLILGDGTLPDFNRLKLSTDHDSVKMAKFPEGVEVVLSAEGTQPYYGEYRINGIQEYILKTGLKGRSWEKVIPEDYLINSFENRLALFHGLVDSDGTPSNGTSIEWGTTSKELAVGMEFLVQSFGGTVTTTEKTPTYTYKGEKKAGRLFYRMHLKLPSGIPLFRLERKLSGVRDRVKYEPVRSISSIEYSHEESATCIKVDADDSLFLTRDFVLTHNTAQASGLLAMLLETGELSVDGDGKGRAIIVPRAPALHQWYKETLRAIPGLNLVIAEGPKKRRAEMYLQPWEALLIGPEMLRNDADALERFKLAVFITDDIDQLRNPETETSYWCDRLGGKADRYIIMSGTPLQKRLPELHAVLDGLGASSVLGTRDNFIRRHVRFETGTSTDSRGNTTTIQRISGYRMLDEVKRKIAPFVLRRTADDISDVHMPTIIPSDVMLELYPAQKAKYKELQKGVVKLLKEGSEKIKHTTALTRLHYGAAICAGLTALGEEDGPGQSVKMDWIMDKIVEGGDLGDEKVVIFANMKATIRALQARMNAAGVGYVTVWGEETNKRVRSQAQEQFWDDPNTRILLGTRAIEQSLNLQNARHLINLDIILNPARMEQLAGRIRRTGSEFRHVYVHNLLTVGTQEERYIPLLSREAALSAHIWGEGSELFSLVNDPEEMLRLISG